MSNRIYNFNAGPAVLPVEVLETTKENLLNYQGSGLGVMELSHRSPEFTEIIETAEANVRELLNVNDDYAVLFTTGGASTQFSMVPMSFLPKDKTASYIITGSWSKKAAKEASKFGEVHIAASSEDNNFNYIPKSYDIAASSAYVHFTSNNTIAGTQWSSEPEVGDAELICDASSDIMHKGLDVTKYGLIYAGAQKNLGPSGVTLVILKKSLLDRMPATLPVMQDYRTYVEKKSLYNTPPTLPIYVVGEVLKWLKKNGGLNAMEKQNRDKAAVLYNCIDNNDFFVGTAANDSRSCMNVTFRLKNEDLEAAFIKEAKEAGFAGLKGHRSVGGMRASIYNACPTEAVNELVNFMTEFAKKNG